MDTVLLGKVDELSGFACGAGSGFDNARGRAGDGNDGAVVRGVERPIKQANTLNLHGGYDLSDFSDVSAFREVGDAFDDGFGFMTTVISDSWLVYEGFISTRCSRGRIVRWR